MIQPLRLFLPLCAAALGLAAGESVGAPLVLDPAQTKVDFTLPSLLHTVHGSFHLKRGTVAFDPLSGKASGEIVVDAASGESGSPARDHRMQGSILESAKYPEITFHPDRVDGKVAPEGRSEVQVHGMFTIHGAEHEILVPATVGAADGRYTVTVSFEVPYVKWGMKNPSTLVLRVSEKVEITIQTVVHPM